MYIYGLMCICYHIGCIYSLMRLYGLMCIRYHIFCIYIISHVLYLQSHSYLWTSDLPIFQYSDFPYDLVPYLSNAVYLSLYGLLWLCTTYMTFCIWNLSTVPSVTPTVSHYHNIQCVSNQIT